MRAHSDDLGTYTGSLKGNDKSGVGVMMYHNGDEYFGLWRYNCRHGIGTMLFGSGGEEKGKGGGGGPGHTNPHHPTNSALTLPLFSSPLLSHSSAAELQWRLGGGARQAESNPPGGEDESGGTGAGGNGSEARYRGEWKFGEMHGFGAMFYGNGCQYVGEFCQNQRSGTGTFTGANGDR